MAHITGLWHATAMSPRYEDLLEPLQRLFGAVVMHDETSDDPAVGRRGGMTWLGDNSIELGAPVGDRSPVRNFVDKLGGGMHSIALQVEDADATRDRLAAMGVQTVASLGADIIFTRPSDTGGLLLEWSATHTDDDPRWGYPLAPRPAPPVAPVSRYGFVTAVVADPAATADRLATLFGTDIVRLVPGAGSGEIAAVVSLVDCLLVLFAVPPDGASWPWGPVPTRARFHGHGLVVDDLPATLTALAEHGIESVRELEGTVFLDPSRLPLPTFLCAELLPEDPRRA